MPSRSAAPGDIEALWRQRLTKGHPRLRIARHIFRLLPSPPRCKLCHNPFEGIGGKLLRLRGFARSHKNPNLCTRCCEALPVGGAEVDIAVLFADVSGSTALGERLKPEAFAALMNRFYRTATEVLVRHDATIDKLIGDEVMALFIPGFCGVHYHRHAVEAAVALMAAVGYRGDSHPWLPLRIAVNSGVAYVGNVGGGGVVDFTALGDPINTASRLQREAAAGEVLMSEPVYEWVAARFPALERRTLTLAGKETPFPVRVLHLGPRLAPVDTIEPLTA